jgi:murein DD-endopeptidase MepM/ murein hydrolase activator NlpD
MSPRTWAARVQAALAERARPKPRHGLELARQAIIVAFGLAGTGVLLYLLFFASIPGSRPAAPPAPVGGVGSSAVSVPPGRDVHIPAQAQLPAATVKAPAPAPLRLAAPLAGRLLVPFGWAYSPTLMDWRLHGGLSIAGAAGDPVHAAAAGTVASVAQDPLWGRMVVVDDGDGVRTEYASLASVDVHEGQRVQTGQVIGSVGDTAAAEAELGPHLYFALVENGRAVDPAPLLEPPDSGAGGLRHP